MLVVVAHGNPCDIDVAVGDCHQAKVFLGETLALGGKAGHCTARRGLGCLSTGVRVDFGVEYEHVDIASGGEDVVETAVTNIVCPSVTTNDPDRFLDQAVGHCSQVLGLRVLGCGEFLLEDFYALTLLLDAQVGGLIGFEQSVHQVRAEFGGEGGQNVVGIFHLLVEGQAEAQAEFGVIFKQRVGPGWAASFLVRGVRGGGQVAAVDGRTAGGVGDDGAVAEELGHQFDVGSLTAARAGAGELEQRFEQLRILDGAQVDGCTIDLGQRSGRIPNWQLLSRATALAAPC